MTGLTADPTGYTYPPELAASFPRIRIEPPHGLFISHSEVWAYRELLYFFVWRDVKVRYKADRCRHRMGHHSAPSQHRHLHPFLWAGCQTTLGRPALSGFLFAALVPWSYFATALRAGRTWLWKTSRLPRFTSSNSSPVSSVALGLIDFAIVLVVLLAMALKFGIIPGIHVLFLPLFLLLAVATTIGVALWFSALNALYRDVRYVTPFLVQILDASFAGGVPSEPDSGKMAMAVGLNPMSGVIEGFRWALTGHGQPSVRSY